MDKINLLLIILGAVLSFSCQQKKVEIYVSPTGNDDAIGTKEHPVQTFQKAKDLATSYSGTSAVNVVFEDGTYYLPSTVTFRPENSGNARYPVVYRAKNEGKAVISGGDRLILNWKPFKDGIFQAQISEDISIDQLYINGERQRMARFPNAVEGKIVFDTWDLTHTREPDSLNDPLDARRVASWDNPEGAYVHAMHYNLWGDMHWLVKGKNDDGTLQMEGGWQNNRPSPMHPRYRIVENVFEELDVEEEWYYDQNKKTLYYYPPKEVELTNAIVEVVRLKHLLEFDGTKEKPVKFIRLKGFVFTIMFY